jgi:hypothetical protein
MYARVIASPANRSNDWVREKATLLETAVTNGTANPNDEHVWNTFLEEFMDAFMDTTR